VIKVSIDTDVLIDYSKDKDTILDKLLSEKETDLYINPVVMAEFLADQNLVNKKKLDETLDFLSRFKMINIGKNIGIKTGEIMRKVPSLKWKDAMIAACCLTENCRLATRNKRHFSKIPGLKFV
jgi:predicted nucleic acid-binding protein